MLFVPVAVNAALAVADAARLEGWRLLSTTAVPSLVILEDCLGVARAGSSSAVVLLDLLADASTFC